MAILRVMLTFSGKEAATVRALATAECLPYTQYLKAVVRKHLALLPAQNANTVPPVSTLPASAGPTSTALVAGSGIPGGGVTISTP
jgi:hypothetical protein